MDHLHLDNIEDSSYVEIQDFLICPVRGRLERTSPCGPSIRNENVQLGLDLLDFGQESLNILFLRDIGGESDGFALDSWYRIELVDCLIDSLIPFCLSGGNEHCFCSRPEECGRGM